MVEEMTVDVTTPTTVNQMDQSNCISGLYIDILDKEKKSRLGSKYLYPQ